MSTYAERERETGVGINNLTEAFEKIWPNWKWWCNGWWNSYIWFFFHMYRTQYESYIYFMVSTSV